jgi:hypothetical protein
MGQDESSRNPHGRSVGSQVHGLRGPIGPQMKSIELTSRPHPARNARRVVGVTSVATTLGIAGALIVSQRSSSADEIVTVEPAPSTLSTLTPQSTLALPTTTARPAPATTAPTTTTAKPAVPDSNPFGEGSFLAGIEDIVVTTTTTTAKPRPIVTSPPATNPPATSPPATPPPATSPPAPPTTVSNGS